MSQGITAKVEGAGALKSYLFDRALTDGTRDFEQDKIGPPPLWNAAVFRNAQAALGGCVEVMVTGSAPLSHETQRFIQTVFNCPVRRRQEPRPPKIQQSDQNQIIKRSTVLTGKSSFRELPLRRPLSLVLLVCAAPQVRQGYGLTETTCAATLGCFETNSWNVGRVLSRRDTAHPGCCASVVRRVRESRESRLL